MDKAPTVKSLDWMPIEKHPLFSNRTKDACPASLSVPQNLLAWDVTSSRLFLWDAGSQCVHRLAVRLRDPDPVSSSTSSYSVVMEAAFPSEMLLTYTIIQATIHHISLNMDGSALLLSGYEGLSVMYLSERTHTVADKISCRTVFLGSRLFSSHNNGLRILQASWHPYSSNHLGVLSSDSVLRYSFYTVMVHSTFFALLFHLEVFAIGCTLRRYIKMFMPLGWIHPIQVFTETQFWPLIG